MAEAKVHFLAYSRETNGRATNVLNRAAIDFSKLLRGAGIQVQFDPDTNRPLEYFIRKGEYDILRDPLFLMAVGIPINLMVSLVANWLATKNNRRSSVTEPASIVIGIKDDQTTVFYDHVGREVPEERIRDLMGLLQADAKSRSTGRKEDSPYPSMPYPVYLEHSDQIVGWAQLELAPRGLMAKPVQFTDEETIRRIRARELRGFSIAAIVKKSTCEICGENYTECTHIAGEKYEGKTCVNHITELDLDEISIVKSPVNEDCLLDAMERSDEPEAD